MFGCRSHLGNIHRVYPHFLEPSYFESKLQSSVSYECHPTYTINRLTKFAIRMASFFAHALHFGHVPPGVLGGEDPQDAIERLSVFLKSVGYKRLQLLPLVVGHFVELIPGFTRYIGWDIGWDIGWISAGISAEYRLGYRPLIQPSKRLQLIRPARPR